MLAMVNRVLIPEHHINKESGEVEGGSIDEKRAEAIRRLAIRELLRQRAGEIGIETEDRLDDAIDELIKAEVDVTEPSEDHYRRYFESNRDRFRTPVHVDVAHILLAAAPDDAVGRVDAREKADELIEELVVAPGRFSEFARNHSRCPSASEGGALGWIGRGQTVAEFENVVLRLEEGLAGKPVESRYGYHVVRVDGRRGGVPLEYEQVRDMIVEYLHESSWRRAVSQYIRVLATCAELQGVELDVAENPLLQ